MDYETSKERGKRLASIEDYEDGAMQGLEEYINRSKERLVEAVSNCNNNMTTKIFNFSRLKYPYYCFLSILKENNNRDTSSDKEHCI